MTTILMISAIFVIPIISLSIFLIFRKSKVTHRPRKALSLKRKTIRLWRICLMSTAVLFACISIFLTAKDYMNLSLIFISLSVLLLCSYIGVVIVFWNCSTCKQRLPIGHRGTIDCSITKCPHCGADLP